MSFQQKIPHGIFEGFIQIVYWYDQVSNNIEYKNINAEKQEQN